MNKIAQPGDWERNHDSSSSIFDVGNLNSEVRSTLEDEVLKRKRKNIMIGLALAGGATGMMGGKILSDKFFTAPTLSSAAKSRIPLVTIPISMLVGSGLGAYLGNRITS